MAIIKKIKLVNYKGVRDVEIDLVDRSNCPVITLIGLNESGKTTILEGLSHFVSGDKSIAKLFDGVHAQSSGVGLIPIHKKAAFTGKIEVIGVVKLDEADLLAVKKLASGQNLIIDEKPLLNDIVIRKSFTFEDSLLKSTQQIYELEVSAKTPRSTKYKRFEPNKPGEKAFDLWMAVANIIEGALPQISYFPTFLVDMPNRIYLAEFDGEKAVNRHYRTVFQDVLDSMSEGLSLKRHVSERIEAFKAGEKTGNWFSALFAGPTKATIDSVFQKISNSVTKEVLGSWQKVFRRAISAKSIFVEWGVDADKDDLPYASFHISDGESRYAISERSLGFRWFFSFLLFTAFKQAKSRSTIFVFDEPAANLHAKAQAELMTSFSRIAAEGNKIIYSTHSHHMINPQWLSGAYIVENSALDYDADDSFGLSAKPTNIGISKYRDFVSQHPSRSSYFQPVIEQLEYVSPEIVGSPPFVLIEGVSDFYALRAVAIAARTPLSFRLMPGTGSGACGPLISLLMGRGDRFLVLLDDDKSGKKEADRYRQEWFLSTDVVMTLGDLDVSFKNRALEGFVDEETVNKIRGKCDGKGLVSKKHIGWYFAEACANGSGEESLSPKSFDEIARVLMLLEERITSGQSSPA